MMEDKKFLVSDYDGTYCLGKDDTCHKNNLEINRFIEKGNVFMISTGRSFEDFSGEYIKKSIPGQYFSCCNGNAVFDYKMNLLRYKTIKLQKLVELKRFANDIEWLDFYDAFGIEDNKNIVECKLRYKSIDVKKYFVDFIYSTNLFSYYHQIDDPLVLHLFDLDDNKIGSINYIANRESINHDNIYTIGDGYNDIEMIKEFNGYTISSAKQIVKNNSIKSYDSVLTLTKSLIKNEVPKRWK